MDDRVELFCGHTEAVSLEYSPKLPFSHTRRLVHIVSLEGLEIKDSILLALAGLFVWNFRFIIQLNSYDYEEMCDLSASVLYIMGNIGTIVISYYAGTTYIVLF